MFSVGSKVLSTAPPVAVKSADNSRTNLIWIDLEMTGLDHNTDHIMEVGCLITNSNLHIISEGINFIIHLSDEVLNNMNAWCKEHHTQSGLVEKCRRSTVSLQEAEDSVLAYIEKQTPKGLCPLAGNSVYIDWLFLMKYMPKVTNHMHHGVVDVSTIKELCRRWSPSTLAKVPPKQAANRSLDDLHESISELKIYKRYFFNSK